MSYPRLVPLAETPGYEMLDVSSRFIPELFPVSPDPERPLRDYARSDHIDFGSPLEPLSKDLAFSRDALYERRNADHDPQQPIRSPEERESDRLDLFASHLQLKILTYINNAHFNLIDEGVPERETGDEIRSFIDGKDQELYEVHSASIDEAIQKIAALDRLDALPDIDDIKVSSAFTPPVGNKEKGLGSMPVTPELERHAYRSSLLEAILRGRKHLERVRFEWISSMYIIGALRKGLKTGNFVNLQGVQESLTIQ